MPEAQPSHSNQPPSNLPPNVSSAEPQDPQDSNYLLIVEDDKGRQEIPLGKSVYAIGRDPKSDIRLYSQFVSRRHATLVRRHRDDGSSYYGIVDGNLKGQPSANGLLINGKKLQAHDLKDEDEIVFGPGVSAKFYHLKRGAVPSEPSDEFDITLISPSMMMGDPEEGFQEEEDNK